MLYSYPQNDLGITYTKAATTFKVWSPVAKEIEAEKAAEVEVKAEEPKEEPKEEPTPVEEPVVEESLTEAKVGTIPSNLPWWIHIMDDEVEEGYKGTPEERTTHLEYVDDDPTDGKAVLPDNIENN